jgi:hypothetical protein
VDLTDFTILASNFNASLPAATAPSARVAAAPGPALTTTPTVTAASSLFSQKPVDEPREVQILLDSPG